MSERQEDIAVGDLALFVPKWMQLEGHGQPGTTCQGACCLHSYICVRVQQAEGACRAAVRCVRALESGSDRRRVKTVILPDGEQFKTLEQVQRIKILVI